jgi:arsenate reductase (glutaredoxin)
MSAPPVNLYGLKTCDTTRAARKWLDARGIAHAFRDVREEPLDRATLERFARALGWERLLNRASTTFRALDEADRIGIDEAKAIALMLAHPVLMKRPLVDVADGPLVGFDPQRWAAAFSSQ